LRTKRIFGFGKESINNSNWEYAYANGFVVSAECLDVLRLGAIFTGGKINPSDNFGQNFDCMDDWELNAQGRNCFG
jgi:hypothetical protein